MLSNLKRYFRPKSIPEALALLEKNSGSILVIAGGTKLVKSRNNIVQELVDITNLPLNYIKVTDNEVRLGATSTMQTLVESPVLARTTSGLLSKAALLSNRSKAIRNQSTLGGELISSGPLSVFYCALLVMQAQVRIAGGEEFALAMNIFLNKRGLGGGVLVETIIPRFAENTYAAMVTIGAENENALICACARLTFKQSACHDVKLALSGTEPVPQRLGQVENLLEGETFNSTSIAQASDLAYECYHPYSDWLASEEYRKEVSRSLVRRTLEQCLSQAEDGMETGPYEY